MRASLTAVWALVLAGGGSVEDSVDLSFHPAPGTILTKIFEVESEGRLQAARLGDIDLMQWLDGLNSLTVESKLRVTDELLEVGAGRPLELLRDFDDLRTTWGWRDRHEVLHPLLYRTVRFVWDAKSGEYDRNWSPPRGSVRELEGLWEDLDFRSLLPDGPVSVGETWYVSLRRIAPVLLPGGSIHRDRLLWDEWKLFELEDTLRPRSRSWFRNDDVACRLEQVVESEGRQLARISVHWTWWGQLDLFPEDAGDSSWLSFATEGAFVDLGLNGRGQLLWDVEGGHFASFELDTDCEVDLELRGTWGRLEVDAEGSARWTAEAANG